MTIKAMVEVLSDFQQGKRIEYRDRSLRDARWLVLSEHLEPSWNFDKYEYRTKPVAREWWIYIDGGPAFALDRKPNDDRPFIHVREVIE